MKRSIMPAFGDGDFIVLGLALSLKGVYFDLGLGLGYLDGYRGIVTFVALNLALAAAGKLVLGRRFHRFAWLGSLLVALLIQLDLCYFRYFQALPSVRLLFQSTGALGVLSSVGGLVQPLDLMLYLDLPLWLWLAWQPTLPRGGRKGAIALQALCLALPAPLYFLRPTLSVVFHQTFATHDFQPDYLRTLGVLGYHVQDLDGTITEWLHPSSPPDPAEIAKVAAFFAGHHDAGNPAAGVCRGKNLILIQCESLQESVVGRTLDGQPVTPNLDRLIRSSLYFPEFYHQVGPGHTADAELLTQQAVYGRPDSVAYWTMRNDHFRALAEVLHDHGYATISMHGNNGLFYNRQQMHPRLGFARSFFEQDLAPGPQLGLGLDDRAFLTQAAQRLATEPKPFYAFLITLSSHYPYDGPYPTSSPLALGALQGTELGRYLAAIHYLDAALGAFVTDLQRRGLWNDTVVALYGDHNGLLGGDRDSLASFLGKPASDRSWLAMQRVPLIVHAPGVPARVIRAPGGQIDVAPTLATLLGVRPPACWGLGHDLLSPGGHLVVQRDGSWIDGPIAHFRLGSRWVVEDEAGRRLGRSPAIAADDEAAERMLAISDWVTGHDWIRRIGPSLAQAQAGITGSP